MGKTINFLVSAFGPIIGAILVLLIMTIVVALTASDWLQRDDYSFSIGTGVISAMVFFTLTTLTEKIKKVPLTNKQKKWNSIQLSPAQRKKLFVNKYAEINQEIYQLGFLSTLLLTILISQVSDFWKIVLGFGLIIAIPYTIIRTNERRDLYIAIQYLELNLNLKEIKEYISKWDKKLLNDINLEIEKP